MGSLDLFENHRAGSCVMSIGICMSVWGWKVTVQACGSISLHFGENGISISVGKDLKRYLRNRPTIHSSGKLFRFFK